MVIILKKNDLLIEMSVNFQDFRVKRLSNEDIDVVKVIIDDNNYKDFNRKKGVYYSIATSIIKEEIYEKEDDLIKTISFVLKDLFKILKINKKDKVLLVGLGNKSVTPDSLGPKTIDNVFITNHLNDKKMRKVSSIVPGVMGQTGLESSDIIKSISNTFKPKLIICIDSLAARSSKRLNKVIQFSTSGINPGSGIGNTRKEISYETMNIPVLSIGIPTVVAIENIAYDVLEFLNLTDKRKEVYYNILNNDLNMIVTSKKIDFEIDLMARILSKSLNNILFSTL